MRDNLIGRPERAQFIGAPTSSRSSANFTGVESMRSTPKMVARPVHPTGVNASSVVFFEACGLPENLS
jgi:hypothetical protein